MIPEAEQYQTMARKFITQTPMMILPFIPNQIKIMYKCEYLNLLMVMVTNLKKLNDTEVIFFNVLRLKLLHKTKQIIIRIVVELYSLFRPYGLFSNSVTEVLYRLSFCRNGGTGSHVQGVRDMVLNTQKSNLHKIGSILDSNMSKVILQIHSWSLNRY